MQDTCLKKKRKIITFRKIKNLCALRIHWRTYLQNRNRLIDIKNRLVFANAEEESERKELGVWGWWMQTITFRMDKQ